MENRVSKMGRIGWIDAAKGIGIIFVILGHSPLSSDVRAFLYAFHIPLFFFLSGLMIRDRHNISLAAKARTLLFPYAALCLILLFIYWSYEKDMNEATTTYAEALWGFVYSSATTLKIDAPVWFLTCLFVAFAYLKAISSVRTDKGLLITGVVLAIVASFYSFVRVRFHLPRLPWSADTALMAVFFMSIGYLSKPITRLLDEARFAPLLSFSAVSFLAVALVTHFNGRSDMLGFHFGRFYLFIPGAFAGIGGCLALASVLSPIKVLATIGRNSLVIFMLQGSALILINIILAEINNSGLVSWPVDNNSTLWGIAYTCAALLILAPICWLINRYAPWISIGLPKSRGMRAGVSVYDGQR